MAVTAAVEPGTKTETTPLSTPDDVTTLATPAVMSTTSPWPSVVKRSSPALTLRTGRR